MRTKYIQDMSAAICIAALIILLISGNVHAGYVTTRLTTNNYPDTFQQISNGNVVWTGYYSLTDDSTDGEIYLYDGKTIKQLTNNNYNDWRPSTSRRKVTWEATPDLPGSLDSEIFLYDGVYTIRLTNNNFADGFSQIDDGKVVWMGNNDGTDFEIFLYDGSTTAQLTNNNYVDWGPYIHNGKVVWTGNNDGNDDEIFLYDGSTTIQLTNNNYADGEYFIHDGKVVWTGEYSLTDISTDGEIYLYDGSITQLTDDDFEEFQPDIKDGKIVWSRSEPSNADTSEIFLYDTATPIIAPIRLTDNNFYDGQAKINNGQVVWNGGPDNILDIFIYDGIVTRQITTNSYDDAYPEIDNSGKAAWIGKPDGYGPWYDEIFLAVKSEQAVSNLEDYIDNMNIPDGDKNSLKAPLKQIETILNDNNPQNDIAACNKLTAFINDVDAKQKTGKLTTAQADSLIQQANAIKNSLGC